MIQQKSTTNENVFPQCLELTKTDFFLNYYEIWRELSGLNDGFSFFEKHVFTLPGARPNTKNLVVLLFFKLFQLLCHFFEFPRLPVSFVFLIFLKIPGFSGSPDKISGFLNRLLTDISFVGSANFFPDHQNNSKNHYTQRNHCSVFACFILADAFS